MRNLNILFNKPRLCQLRQWSDCPNQVIKFLLGAALCVLAATFCLFSRKTPARAQIVSHRLMLRAGMIKQASAGIYSWLPLGFKVLRKIENIVHEEQQRAGTCLC